MSDCTNVEMRELLPEFLHDRLTASDRERLDAHLARCEECAAELATLRAVQRAFTHAPAVDTAAIVRALPAPPRQVAPRATTDRIAPRFYAWRIAAAISFISLGGISLAVARTFFSNESPMRPVDSTTTVSVDSPRTAATVPPGTPGRPAITFGGGVSDLATEDLEELLGTIESLEAAPPVEPDVVPQSEAGRVKGASGE